MRLLAVAALVAASACAPAPAPAPAAPSSECDPATCIVVDDTAPWILTECSAPPGSACL